MGVVELGTAGNYVILAKSAINNNPTSAFTGDLGLSPMAESFITGFSQTAATGYSTSDQVAGNVTIGTNSHFEGIILSMTGITLNTGASLNGRILAQTAAIFDANTVVEPQ